MQPNFHAHGCLSGHDGFNPCFLGTCPRTTSQVLRRSPSQCFNPCFLGTCPRTLNVQVLQFQNYHVSILVFLELALGHQALDMIDAEKPWFQSLFSWNLPSDNGRASKKAPMHSSFNPCFLGTCPRTLRNDPTRPGKVLLRFQSLFSWNLPSDGIS